MWRIYTYVYGEFSNWGRECSESSGFSGGSQSDYLKMTFFALSTRID